MMFSIIPEVKRNVACIVECVKAELHALFIGECKQEAHTLIPNIFVFENRRYHHVVISLVGGHVEMSAATRHVNVAIFVVLMRKIDFIRVDSVGVVHCKHIVFECNRRFVCRIFFHGNRSAKVICNFQRIFARKHFVYIQFPIRKRTRIRLIFADQLERSVFGNRIAGNAVLFARNGRIHRAVFSCLEHNRNVHNIRRRGRIRSVRKIGDLPPVHKQRIERVIGSRRNCNNELVAVSKRLLIQRYTALRRITTNRHLRNGGRLHLRLGTEVIFYTRNGIPYKHTALYKRFIILVGKGCGMNFLPVYKYLYRFARARKRHFQAVTLVAVPLACGERMFPFAVV